MKTLKYIALMAIACAGFMGLAPKVSAITVFTIGDSHDLGSVEFAIPFGDADRIAYVNHLVGMAINTTGSFSGQFFTRDGNSCGSCLAIVSAGHVDNSSMGQTNVDLGAGGFLYLIAKYDGPNYGAVVWYVGGLTGMITIPATAGQYGLSGWTLFAGEGTFVPDGGSTIAFLGLALAGAELLRRTFSYRRVVVKA